MKHTVKKKKKRNKAFSKSLWNLHLTSIWTLAHIYSRLHECVLSVCFGHYWLFSAVWNDGSGTVDFELFDAMMANSSQSNAQIFGVLLVGFLGFWDSGCGGAACIGPQGAIVLPYFCRYKVVIILFIF